MPARAVAFAVVMVCRCAAQTATFESHVADFADGPIAGAKVELRREGDAQILRSMETDHAGRFHFAGLAPGPYVLAISAPGFETKRVSHLVSAAESAKLPSVRLEVGRLGGCAAPGDGMPRVELTRIRGGAELRGAVDQTSGAQPPAVVTLARRGTSYETTATKGGWFTFMSVEPGIYTLRVRRPGFADFVMDSATLRARYRTVIQDALQMPGCPESLQCQPVREVTRVSVCR
jgi:large repetitive protein